jgi:hypothetical protein
MQEQGRVDKTTLNAGIEARFMLISSAVVARSMLIIEAEFFDGLVAFANHDAALPRSIIKPKRQSFFYLACNAQQLNLRFSPTPSHYRTPLQ